MHRVTRNAARLTQLLLGTTVTTTLPTRSGTTAQCNNVIIMRVRFQFSDLCVHVPCELFPGGLTRVRRTQCDSCTSRRQNRVSKRFRVYQTRKLIYVLCSCCSITICHGGVLHTRFRSVTGYVWYTSARAHAHSRAPVLLYIRDLV